VSRPRLPLVLVPWAVYVGVTVVAPAVNGATRDPAFADHAVITLGVSGAVLLLWLAAMRRRSAVPRVSGSSARSRP
jgi:hypothetical protein